MQYQIHVYLNGVSQGVGESGGIHRRENAESNLIGIRHARASW